MTAVDILIMLVGAALLFLFRKAEKRTRAFSWGFGMLLAAALVRGGELYRTNQLWTAPFTWTGLGTALFSFAGLSMLISAVCMGVLPRLSLSSRGTESALPRFFFPLCQGLILCAWIPALLAYWPGIHSYDVWSQTPQALGPLSGYTRYHPPLHTLFWAFCLRAGDKLGLNPLTLYAVLQMGAVSGAFAWVVYTLRRMGAHPALVIFALCFYALNPALAVFSLITTKDVLFGAFLLLLFLQSILLVRDPDTFLRRPRSMIGFAVCGVVTLLLRNNALYMLLLAMPFFLICLRRHFPRVLLLFALCLIPYGLVNGPVYSALGIQPGEEAEALSVPMMQMARVAVAHGEDLTEEERSALARYFPMEQLSDLYNPRFADPVKGSFDQAEYLSDRGAFFRLWFSLLQKYPASFADAFWDLNLPSWYPGGETPDPWSQRDYIEVENQNTLAFPVERRSLLPGALTLYNRVADFSAFQGHPLLSWCFSISTPIWLLLLCAVTLGWKHRWRLALPLTLPFFLWVTFLAGPVSNFRYMEPLMVMIPLWAAMALQPEVWRRPDASNAKVSTH